MVATKAATKVRRTANLERCGRSFLSPLVVAFKVCQVCLARVYRGFWILNPCTTRVRPVYGMGYIVAKCLVTKGAGAGES
jgi:hypothetical protein